MACTVKALAELAGVTPRILRWYDSQRALQSHLTEPEARRERLDGLILAVKNAIIEAKGGNKISVSQKFEAFKRQIVETNEARYGKEIREKYSGEAVEQSNARVLSMPPEDQARWQVLRDAVLAYTAQ